MLEHWKKPRVIIDVEHAHEQQQSLLFTMLPLDIRRHIYLQLWLDYGTTQHIYLFGANSYLSHYPCLLEKDAFNHHRPPSPPPAQPEHPADAVAEAAPQTLGEDSEPEPHDDPGDIDGALLEIAAPLPASSVATGFGNGVHDWNGSPWCMHEKCFCAYMEVFDMSFERGYSRNYRRARVSASEVGIAKPFLVCRKMYTEANESLYSKVAFSFPNVLVLKRFMNDVPPSLRERIQVVDIMTTVIPDGTDLSWSARGLCVQDPTLLPLPSLCTQLKSVSSNVQELRLCVHLTGHKRQDSPRKLPHKEWFEPFYRLFNELSQQKLRKLEIKLVTRCDIIGSGGADQDVVTYGSTPEFLNDAPFSVVLVPQGWHSDSDCCAYWVDQTGGQGEEGQI